MASGGMAARNRPNNDLISFDYPVQKPAANLDNFANDKPQQKNQMNWGDFEERKDKKAVSAFEDRPDSDCDLELDSDNEEVKQPGVMQGLASI